MQTMQTVYRNLISLTAALILAASIGLIAAPAYAKSTSSATKLATSIALPTFCSLGSWQADRFGTCIKSRLAEITFTSTETGRTVGKASFLIDQNIELSPTALSFVENIEIRNVVVTGQTGAAVFDLAVTCGGTCKATSHFPNGTAIKTGAVVTGTIEYVDSIALDGANRTHSTYTLTWGSTTTQPSTWESPDYRCDRIITKTGGCVVPDYIPTMTTMAQLPNIAANIARIQKAGTNHYGRGSDGLPLSRNSSLEDKNRNASCPASRTRPSGKSCDEYPFATTDQGASQTKQPDWGWAWVPVTEQNRQGGFISGFYTQNRVMDGIDGAGDKYWVQV